MVMLFGSVKLSNDNLKLKVQFNCDFPLQKIWPYRGRVSDFSLGTTNLAHGSQ